MVPEDLAPSSQAMGGGARPHTLRGASRPGSGKSWGLQGGWGGARARQRWGICLLRMITRFACDSSGCRPAPALAVMDHRPGHAACTTWSPTSASRAGATIQPAILLPHLSSPSTDGASIIPPSPHTWPGSSSTSWAGSGWKLGRKLDVRLEVRQGRRCPGSPGLQKAVEASRPARPHPKRRPRRPHPGRRPRRAPSTASRRTPTRRSSNAAASSPSNRQQTGWAAPASPLHAGWPPSSR